MKKARNTVVIVLTLMLLILGQAGFIGQSTSYASAPPDDPKIYPSNVNFTDTDPHQGAIGGVVTWDPSKDETHVTSYTIRYENADGVRVGNTIGGVKKGEPYRFTIPSGTILPDGAAKLRIQIVDDGNGSPGSGETSNIYIARGAINDNTSAGPVASITEAVYGDFNLPLHQDASGLRVRVYKSTSLPDDLQRDSSKVVDSVYQGESTSSQTAFITVTDLTHVHIKVNLEPGTYSFAIDSKGRPITLSKVENVLVQKDSTGKMGIVPSSNPMGPNGDPYIQLSEITVDGYGVPSDAITVPSAVYVYDNLNENWSKTDQLHANVFIKTDGNGHLPYGYGLQVQVADMTNSTGDRMQLPDLYAGQTLKIEADLSHASFAFDPIMVFGSSTDPSFDTDGVPNGWSYDDSRHLIIYAQPTSTAMDNTDDGIADRIQQNSIFISVSTMPPTAPTDEFKRQYRGLTFSSNASSYSTPLVVKEKNKTRLFEYVGGPHYLTDGSKLNVGWYKTFLPSTLLKSWNIKSSKDLKTYVGDGEKNENEHEINFEATGTVETGIFLTINNLSYSVHTVSIVPPIIEEGSDTPPDPVTIPPVMDNPGSKDKPTPLDPSKDGKVTSEKDATGRETVKVALDSEKLQKALLEAQGNNNHNVQISLGDSAPVYNIELPIRAFSSAGSTNKDSVISIKTDTVSYQLPLSILTGLTTNGIDPNTAIRVTIAKSSDKVIDAVKKVNSEVKVLVHPMEFNIQVQTNQGLQAIDDFGGKYVDRVFELSSEVSDTSRVTAVTLDPETGALSFIPAMITTIDGRTSVIVHSPHNSSYTVVENNKWFADSIGHWAKDGINLMASKLLVKGTSNTEFSPEKTITRAEFTSMLVRGLGLKELASTDFTDVHSDTWYAGAIGAAVKAGIINGTSNNAFQPYGMITREQMAVIIIRALQNIGQTLPGTVQIDAFTDLADVGDWARTSVAEAVRTGLLRGMSENVLAPKQEVSRAQATVLLERFLQSIKFMN